MSSQLTKVIILCCQISKSQFCEYDNKILDLQLIASAIQLLIKLQLSLLELM